MTNIYRLPNTRLTETHKELIKATAKYNMLQAHSKNKSSLEEEYKKVVELSQKMESLRKELGEDEFTIFLNSISEPNLKG